jgi:enamine deaminase RidA (YjgF/YER057c/UK114 family)
MAFFTSRQYAALLFLSGQAALDEKGEVVGPNDVDVQLKAAYENIGKVLRRFECNLTDLVEETIYVTDVHAAAGPLAAQRRVIFGGRPLSACTVVEVKALGLPTLMVEIRAVAAIPEAK